MTKSACVFDGKHIKVLPAREPLLARTPNYWTSSTNPHCWHEVYVSLLERVILLNGFQSLKDETVPLVLKLSTVDLILDTFCSTILLYFSADAFLALTNSAFKL